MKSVDESLLSWGLYPRRPQKACEVQWSSEIPSTFLSKQKILPRGEGRSYGDSCLSTDGTLVLTKGLNRFISFDQKTGLLCAEAGVTLQAILELCIPLGYFLPVSPGTKFVTLGGAVANDIHGKNHHSAGSFGNHVTRFSIYRSDAGEVVCSKNSNPDLFSATIGGLGLTGVLSWIELQMKPIQNPWITQESIQFHTLAEFASLSKESDTTFEYTVAWIDCLNKNGKGLFYRGRHAEALEAPSAPLKLHKKRTLSVPVLLPFCPLNSWTIGAFNWLYWHKQLSAKKSSLCHYDPFFYPLDGILSWNRIYGRDGFLQYQFVLPADENGMTGLQEIFLRIAKSGLGSFLAVLKTFGPIPSLGMLSFSRPGVTLALDFPISQSTFKLLNDLDSIIFSNGGALYPAKDSRMTIAGFQQSFPLWRSFQSFIDPKIESDFSKRVGLT